jgi:hypothetical protein
MVPAMEVRAGSVRLVGVSALAAGAVSATILAVDGNGRFGGAWTGAGPTVYGPQQLLLAVTLAAAGLTLLVTRTLGVAAAALGMAGLCAAQLAGTGLVSVRRWPLYRGCCSAEAITQEGLVRVLSALMAGVCALSALACVALLIVGHFATWSRPTASRAIALGAGGVVMVVGPLLVTEHVSGDLRDLLAWALVYSVPIGAALALSGTLQRPAAWAVSGAVIATALTATAGTSFLETRLPWGSAQELVVAAAVVVALSRIRPPTRTAA